MTSLINIPLLQNRPINITYVYASHLFKTIYTVYAAIYWHTFYGHPCQDVGMWCNFVTQIRSVSPTFWEMKICIFCPTLGRSWCDFELVQFESEATNQKLKQAITARFRTRRCCSCWERRAVFFRPKTAQLLPQQRKSREHSTGRYLYSEGQPSRGTCVPPTSRL